MGLAVASLHAVFLDDISNPVIVGSIEVCYGDCPVHEESFTFLDGTDDLTGEDRQPWNKVVSTAGAEFFDHNRCPVLASCFIAVCQEVLDALFSYHASSSLLVHVKILVEIPRECARIKFVDFEAGSFLGGRAVLVSSQRPSQAEHLPVTFRNIPGESTVFYERTYVDDLLREFSISLGQIVVDVMRCAESCLLF